MRIMMKAYEENDRLWTKSQQLTLFTTGKNIMRSIAVTAVTISVKWQKNSKNWVTHLQRNPQQKQNTANGRQDTVHEGGGSCTDLAEVSSSEFTSVHYTRTAAVGAHDLQAKNSS